MNAFRLNLLSVNHRWLLSVAVIVLRTSGVLSAVLCRRLLTGIFILREDGRAVDYLISLTACTLSICLTLVLGDVARIVRRFTPLFDIYLLLIATTLYSSFL